MYKKQIIVKGDEVRAKIIKGADYLAECVKATLGPFGQNWILPNIKKVSNDGLAVASEIRMEDEVENEGAKAMHRIATAVAEKAFDATSTAVTLAQAILKESSKLLGNREKGIIAKKSPIDIKYQIEKECEEVSAKLLALATPIKSKAQLVESAMVSVENKELAELIGNMQWDLGPDGYIIADTAGDTKSTIERVAGYRVENSFSTALIINNQETQSMEVVDTAIILTNYTIGDMKPFQSVLEMLAKSGTKRVVIMAKMFSLQAIQTCLDNINRGGIQVYPLNAPVAYGPEYLKDIESVVGGTFYHDEERQLEDLLASDVGYAKKVIANKSHATFIVDKKNDKVATRVQELEDKLKSDISAYDKSKINERVAQLKNGFAVLKIGSSSSDDKSYRKDKVDDAVNAVRLALQGGVVAGAGLAYKEVADTLSDDYILKTPLRSINKWIMESAPSGFVIEDWVKDPAKVLDIALREACIGAGTIATVGGVAVFENEKPSCNCNK